MYSRAAELENPDALLALGTAKRPSHIFFLLLWRSPCLTFALARLLCSGDPRIPKDVATAEKLLRKAVEMKNDAALLLLANLLEMKGDKTVRYSVV